MKQIEITVKVNNTLDEVDKILLKQGFKIIRKSRVEDEYLTSKKQELTKEKIIEVLNSAVLIRYLKTEDAEFKKITYKIKEYKNNIVTTEEKINVNIDNIENAIKLFYKLHFELLASVKYDVIVYSNGKYEFAFQNVENLGLLLEFEHSDNFENYTTNKIIKEKEKMLKIVKNTGLSIENDYDVKKAYELILKEINSKKEQ